MKKKRIIWTGIAAVGLAIGLYQLIFVNNSSSDIEILTIKSKKGEVTTMVTATGTIEPVEQVAVGTQVSGVVEKIYADYNSVVAKGQLLAELDKTVLRSTLSKQQANYEKTVHDLDYLQTIYDRQKVLYENKVISNSDYEEALYNLKVAKNSVTETLADLKSAKTNLSYANIYSPIDGVVLSRDVDEGQTVASSYSTPTLFTIAEDLKQMQVEADVDEADIGQVKAGQRVSFTVDAYQNEEFSGTVTQVRLNPTTTSNVVTYTVVIKADNPELKLKPGLTATISIYTIELKDVLTIEAKAVNFRPDPTMMMAYLEQHKQEKQQPPKGKRMFNDESTTVWVTDNGTVKPKEVVLGTSDGVNVQVLSGLQEGEELVYQMRYTENTKTTPSGSQESESPFMPPKPPGGGRRSQ